MSTDEPANGQNEQDEQMQKIASVQARYSEELLAKPHVVGLGIGLAQRGGQYTDELALIVMVDEKVPADQLAPEERIPGELDGVPVDVQRTGPIVA